MIRSRTNHCLAATSLAALLPFLSTLPAAEPLPTAALEMATTGRTAKDTFDDIWSLAKLYDDKENPYIQKIAFTGRAQFDYTYTKGNTGMAEDWFVRRLRAGFKATLFEDFTLHAEADFNPQAHGPAYQRLTDAYLAWSTDPRLVLKVGKQSAAFTLDGHTSSKELITIDRSNVSNNLWFPEEYIPGISASGEIDKWRYFAGYYWSGSKTPEFGNFDAGHFGLASIGYDFSECLDADEALLNVDFLYNDPHPGNTFTRSLRQVGSVNFAYKKGRYGLGTDVSAGDGYGSQSNIFGFLVMPYVDITDKLQLVGRYTHLGSDDGMNGIRLARYESVATTGRGDDYDELYLGLNYYLYGHKLKLQTGLTYAMMDDDANNGGAWDGWGLTTGLRISW